MLVLVTLAYLNSCNSNRLINRAIENLQKADSLLDSAKKVLASAAINMDSAGYHVKNAKDSLDEAKKLLDKIKDINDKNLNDIHISVDNVNSIDKRKKAIDDFYRKRINDFDSKITELQTTIDSAQKTRH